MATHRHFLWTDLFHRDRNPEKSIVKYLGSNILFSKLSSRELKYLSEIVFERTYQKGEPVFQQNDRGLGMYLIVKGEVAIESKTQYGEALVTTLTEGSFFGEIALIDPATIRTASATATQSSTLIGFFKPELNEILERKPSMGVKILLQLSVVLARRLQETTLKISNRTSIHHEKN
jgi:CRP-like cAMP-binding protein